MTFERSKMEEGLCWREKLKGEKTKGVVMVVIKGVGVVYGGVERCLLAERI